MIIWEEYRLHAIVFTLRCISVYLFEVFTPDRFRGTTLHRLLFVPIVLGHHLVVDEITRRHGSKEGRTTVRSGTNAKDTASWKIIILRAYSFYQFLALGSHLVPRDIGTTALGDAGFNTLIAIQSSAFLMTLFRKGLIKDHSHAIWYTMCLVFSSFHILRMFPSYMFLGKIVCAFLLRTRLRVNKYFLWTGFVLASLPAVDAFLQSALVFVWDTVSRGDAHTLYGETSAVAVSLYRLKDYANYANVDGITASGLRYWQDVKSNVASGYATVKTIDYHHGLNQGYAQVQELDAKYKLTAAMLTLLAGIWIRGGVGIENIVGGLLRPVAPAAGSTSRQSADGSCPPATSQGENMKKESKSTSATKRKNSRTHEMPGSGVAHQFESERERSF